MRATDGADVQRSSSQQSANAVTLALRRRPGIHLHLTEATRKDGGAGVSRLLIIDADTGAAAMLGEIARETGFDATRVAGLELREARESDPDRYAVICLDLQPRGVDGIQLLRALGARGCRAGILLMSTLDRRVLTAARRLAAAHGLHLIGALAKPLDATAVRGLLRAFQPAAGVQPEAPAAYVSMGDLQRGLDLGEVQVHFQPKIVVDTLDFSGVEALVRWSAPERGNIPPDAFIALAERSGLIAQLTRTVMARAFEDCAAWHAEGIDTRTAINLSPRSLGDLELPDIMQKLADEHGVEPSRIVVEITEGWREQDDIIALDVLTRLRLKGFTLSIDDFGTGYSTMLQLKRIPFNELKLSGSFIQGAASDREARVILESSVSLGRQLGLHVVAEGIERQEDWDLVTELGCDEAQGYFVARPMRAEVLSQWLVRWNRLLGR
jgi:EAL domain-containing protein (putative c-di-GMP-specific phosphodiesterase class I)